MKRFINSFNIFFNEQGKITFSQAGLSNGQDDDKQNKILSELREKIVSLVQKANKKLNSQVERN